MTDLYMLDDNKNKILMGYKISYNERNDASLVSVLGKITTVTLIMSASSRFLYIFSTQYDSSSEQNIYKWTDSASEYQLSITHNLLDDSLYTIAMSGRNPITFNYAILSFM